MSYNENKDKASAFSGFGRHVEKDFYMEHGQNEDTEMAYIQVEAAFVEMAKGDVQVEHDQLPGMVKRVIEEQSKRNGMAPPRNIDRYINHFCQLPERDLGLYEQDPVNKGYSARMARAEREGHVDPDMRPARVTQARDGFEPPVAANPYRTTERMGRPVLSLKKDKEPEVEAVQEEEMEMER